MPDSQTRIREIRAKLDAIAPWPESETVTAADLGRHFAVRAQERFTKMLHPAVDADPQQVSAMGAEFAAAHALYALAAMRLPEGVADGVAPEIRDAISDGGEIGPWLFGHLGKETSQAVAALAEELAEAQPARPKVVCLCGSTRFGNFFRAANLRLTLAGEIVLSIGCDTKSDADLHAAGELGIDVEQAKAGLDDLHKRKIDLADYVHVVAPEDGYFGNSTLSEIEYALTHGKPVTFANEAAAKRARDHGLVAEASHA
jgi:hypothetical protein